jgi:hypothetical protein
MCVTDRVGGTRFAPEIELADLIHAKLGLRIPTAEIKAFVLENWKEASTLAHAIHDNKPDKPTLEEKVEQGRAIAAQAKEVNETYVGRDVVAIAGSDGSVKFYERSIHPLDPDAKIKLIKAR